MTVVWITGASSGIGRGIAEVAAKDGCDLILSARRTSELETLRSSLPDPARAKILVLDVADHAAIAPAAAEAWAWKNCVDVLINNAGITQRSTALETSIETARRIMEVNYFASIELTRAVLPKMIAANRGQLVFVSSVAGYVATPMRSSYSAAKHAVRAWADALRAELHDTDLSVTVVCPGYIATGISALALTGDGKPQGSIEPTDAAGTPVAVAAEKIWRGIRERRAEVFVGGRELMAIYLKRFAPGLVIRLLPKFAPKKPPPISAG